MSTVKLCAFSRTFYPYVYGSKLKTIFGAFLVIENGKIIKRSFCECRDFAVEDHAENEAFAKGLEWVVANMDDLRDTNLQVFFCGAARVPIKKRIDENRYFTGDREIGGEPVTDHCTFIGNEKLLKMFNKVTYHIAASITINDGDDDDPENVTRFNLYEAVGKYFTLLYGDDVNYGHTVYVYIPDDTLPSGMRVKYVGLPEMHTNTVWGKVAEWT